MCTRAGQHAALWCCLWGRGQKGNNAACLAIGRLSVTSSTTHKQIGFFWCWFQGRWVCAHFRTPWVPLMDSPVRLGVSLATPTPTVFIDRGFEALFPHTDALCCVVCLALLLFLPVYLHMNVGPPGLPATTLLCILSAPAAHLHPSYQSQWMFLL